ncbi:hypothetical protein PG993_012276 [Apiospora rasikravindrae]
MVQRQPLHDDESSEGSSKDEDPRSNLVRDERRLEDPRRLIGLPAPELAVEVAKPRDLDIDGWLAVPGVALPESRKLRQVLIMHGFEQGVGGNYAVGDDPRISPTHDNHFLLAWIGCIHDGCTEHLAEKLEGGWFPRRIGKSPIRQPHLDHFIGKIKTTIPDPRRAYLLVERTPQWPRECHLERQDWRDCTNDEKARNAFKTPKTPRLGDLP